MKLGIRQWKSYARQVLRGNYGKPIFGTIAMFFLNLVCGNITAVLFPGDTILTLLLSQVFAFVLSMLLWIFSTGFAYMMLKLSRGKTHSTGDLLYFFKNQPDRLMASGFVLALISLVCSVPVTYFNVTSVIGPTLEEQTAWMSQYILLTVLSLVFTMILGLPFSMAMYLQADNPEMGGMEALKTSARMMKGHILKYLLLQISFVPWILLSVFTLYIAMLWIFPYMEMSSVMFYRDLYGEFDPAPKGTQKAPGNIQAMAHWQGESDNAKDDYNAEA